MAEDSSVVQPQPQRPALPSATIHEATLAPGTSGVVLHGPAIDFPGAVARRQAGRDVVVCGDDIDANRRVAFAIEASVGPPTRPQKPHKIAGPAALPHFLRKSGRPGGHCFYETSKPPRKARKGP
jgi:hypothetical protein